MAEKITSMLPWIQLLTTLIIMAIGATLWISSITKSEAQASGDTVRGEIAIKIENIASNVNEIKTTIGQLDAQMRLVREWKAEVSLLVRSNSEAAKRCLQDLQQFRAQCPSFPPTL